jgi:hypothetical protein
VHVGHAVGALADGLHLFEQLLGGRRVDEGATGAARWVDLRWPGPGRVRLLEPTSHLGPVAAWLGGRRGRVHHLAFTCRDPATIDGAVPNSDGSFEVAPERAQGTRLLLLPA